MQKIKDVLGRINFSIEPENGEEGNALCLNAGLFIGDTMVEVMLIPTGLGGLRVRARAATA